MSGCTYHLFRIDSIRRLTNRTLQTVSGIPLERIARTIRHASKRSFILLALAHAKDAYAREARHEGDTVVVPIAWGTRTLTLELKKGLPLGIIESSSAKRADTVAACLAQALWDDDRALARVNIDKSAARGLCRWVESDIHPHPGTILRLTFSDVRWESEAFERIALQGPNLSSSELVKRLWDEPSVFRDVKAMTPLFPEVSRHLTCYVSSNGKLTISLPDLRTEEIRAVVEGFGEEIVSLSGKLSI